MFTWSFKIIFKFYWILILWLFLGAFNLIHISFIHLIQALSLNLTCYLKFPWWYVHKYLQLIHWELSKYYRSKCFVNVLFLIETFQFVVQCFMLLFIAVLYILILNVFFECESFYTYTNPTYTQGDDLGLKREHSNL